jgi:tetratricopeptide (TPR) repeat protein
MRIEWLEKYMKEAEGLIYENKVEEGLTALDNLLYDEPGYGSLHNHLGWAYLYYTVDVEKAERHLKLAIRFESEFPAPYLHLGTLYVRLGRYAEAIDALETGMAKAGANKVAMLECIGQAYELKREYARAIKAYKQAMISTTTAETFTLTEGIKRCRKKRLMMMFTF